MFAFSAIEPTTSGVATQMDVPYSDWLSTMFSEAVSDPWTSPGWALYRNRYDKAFRDWGEVITPELANRLYGIEDGVMPLVFDKPINLQQAAIEHERRREQLKRLQIIGSATHSALSLRGLGTLTATLAASVAHPVDLAMAFFPAIGSTERAAMLATTGASAWRLRLLRGLATSEEELAKMGGLIGKFPRLSASVIDASVGEAVYQIPNFIDTMMKSDAYEAFNEYAQNVGMAGAFGGVLRMGLESLARGLPFARDLYLRMFDREKEAAFRMAFNNQIRGEMIRADEIASMSEDVLLKKAEFDMAEARKKAESSLLDPAIMSEIQLAAEARLKVHGSLGSINQKNLRSLVDSLILRGGGTDVAETPEFKMLEALNERYKKAAQEPLPKGAKEPGYESIFDGMAEVLGLKFDPSAKEMPDFYAGLLQGEKIEIPKKDIPEAPELLRPPPVEPGKPPPTKAEMKGRIATLKMRLEMAKTPEAKAKVQEELDALGVPAAQKGEPAAPKAANAIMTPEERAAIVEMQKARNAAEINRLVEEERQVRIQGFLDRAKQEAIEEGKTKAILELQKDGRLVDPEVLKTYATKETLTDSDVAIFEADGNRWQEILGVQSKQVDDALAGKTDPEAEANYNATAAEKGLPEIDFDELRKAAELYKMEDMVDKIEQAFHCVITKVT